MTAINLLAASVGVLAFAVFRVSCRLRAVEIHAGLRPPPEPVQTGADCGGPGGMF